MNSKGYRSTAACIIMVLIAAAVEAAGIGWSLDTSVYSRYVSRGVRSSEGAVLQPSLTVTSPYVSLNAFGNYDGDVKDVTELDLTASKDFTVDKLTVTGGYIRYHFPKQEEGRYTSEIFVGGALDMPLSPAVAVYYDYDQGNGTYAQFSLGHSVDMKPLSFALSTSVGYNDHQFRDASGWCDYVVRAAASVPLASFLQLTLSATQSFSLDKNDFTDEFFWGLGTTIGF